MHPTTSILRKKSIKQGPASKKVVFPKYNAAEEDDRQLRGVRLTKQLRKEKELNNKMAQNVSARGVYAALVDPANLVGLNTLATHNRSFRVELFTVFGDIAALPNANINPQQANALGVLNALIAANLPFPNIAGDPNIQDVLTMIGALERFRPFLNPPIGALERFRPSLNPPIGALERFRPSLNPPFRKTLTKAGIDALSYLDLAIWLRKAKLPMRNSVPKRKEVLLKYFHDKPEGFILTL